MNDIKLVEEYLTGTINPQESLLLQAKMLLDSDTSHNMEWQKKTYSLINHYGRKKLKNELESIHCKLMNEPEHQSFRNRIIHLFTKK